MIRAALFFAALVLGFIVFIHLVGCASRKVNTCSYICRDHNAPVNCYCLEDEIKSEASK